MFSIFFETYYGNDYENINPIAPALTSGAQAEHDQQHAGDRQAAVPCAGGACTIGGV